MYYYDVLIRSASGPKTRLTYHSPIQLVAGRIVKAPLLRRQVTGLVLGETKQPKFNTKLATPIVEESLPEASLKLLEWLAQYYGVDPALALRQLIPTNLPKRPKLPEAAVASERGFKNYRPTPEQVKAIDGIARGVSTTYLLHGQTASGKTLVYRELAKPVLAQGKSVIILLPEIALTPQLAADFSDLSEQLFISHSGLSESQRQRIWLYCLQQDSPFLMIGPRSTLFYPYQNLGLIILDEAHETSYKQDQAPRYQAQTVAAQLAKYHGAKLVLGSATPRISDYWLAKAKDAPILSLTRHHPRRPKLTIIDQRQSDEFSQSRILSNQLINRLQAVHASGGQSLLYLNRRGTAAMVICAQCGWVPLCPRCEIAMSLHHDIQRLICHQCGRQNPVPINCPVCKSSELIYRGAGTKAVEREVARLLPDAKLKRFDSDSPAAESFSRLYKQVRDKKIDILVGTQGLANGLDLPALKLVGVVSADSELYLPDFSAAERAFQLLFQVIGRAGRRGGGEVVIQTHNPYHPAIAYAMQQDYEGFYAQELAIRKKHKYPPFGYLLALIVRSKSIAKGLSAAEQTVRRLGGEFGLKHILGPAPAFHFKQGGYYRHVLVVRSAHRPVLAKVASEVGGQPDWQADIDPVNLLF